MNTSYIYETGLEGTRDRKRSSILKMVEANATSKFLYEHVIETTKLQIDVIEDKVYRNEDFKDGSLKEYVEGVYSMLNCDIDMYDNYILNISDETILELYKAKCCHKSLDTKNRELFFMLGPVTNAGANGVKQFLVVKRNTQVVRTDIHNRYKGDPEETQIIIPDTLLDKNHGCCIDFMYFFNDEVDTFIIKAFIEWMFAQQPDKKDCYDIYESLCKQGEATIDCFSTYVIYVRCPHSRSYFEEFVSRGAIILPHSPCQSELASFRISGTNDF